MDREGMEETLQTGKKRVGIDNGRCLTTETAGRDTKGSNVCGHPLPATLLVAGPKEPDSEPSGLLR